MKTRSSIRPVLLLLFLAALVANALGPAPTFAINAAFQATSDVPAPSHLNLYLLNLQTALADFAAATDQAERDHAAQQVSTHWAKLIAGLDDVKRYLDRVVAGLSAESRALAQLRAGETLQALDQQQQALATQFEQFSAAHKDDKAHAAQALQAQIALALAETAGKPIDFSQPNALPSGPEVQPASIVRIGLANAAGLHTPDQAYALALSPPITDDLMPTDETAFAPEISTLAAQLSFDPARIYDYVLNNIQFEPYYGSRKGALMTLFEHSGNDVDTASLLIALYRASGHYARYVQGKVAIDGARARNWVGNAGTVDIAADIFSRGTLSVEVSADGYLIKPHVWVAVWPAGRSKRVYMPVVARSGGVFGVLTGFAAAPVLQPTTPVTTGQWIQVDASFKQYTFRKPMDLKPITGFSATTWLSETRAATPLSDTLQALLDLPRVQSPTTPDDTDNQVSYMELKADDAISRTMAYVQAKPNLTVGEMLGGAFIVTQTIRTLTNTLPYSITANQPMTDSRGVPEIYRHYVNLQIYGGVPTSRTLSYTATQASLANKRVIVSFEAATPGDQSTIDQYGGSLINTPPSLVKLVPVLRINGVEAARGISVTGASAQTWQVTFVDGRSQKADASNRIRAGEMLAFGFAYGHASADAVAASQKRLAVAREAIPKDATGVTLSNTKQHMGEPVMGETLHLMLQSYYNQVDMQTELIARNLGIRWFRGRAVGVAIQTLALDCFLFVCFGVSGGGLSYDIARNSYAGLSLNKNAQDEAAFYLLTGHITSSLEHELFEQVGQRGLSTMRLLSMALVRGMPVYRITKANWAQVSPRLKINASVKQNIQSAVNSGDIVTVHEGDLKLGDWTGVGWIVTDPVSGGFGYLISGGLGDSVMTTQGGSLWDVLKKILAYAWLGGNIALDIWGLIAAVGLFFTAPFTLPLLLIGGGLILLNLLSLYSDLDDLVTLINGDKSIDQYIGEQLAGLAIGVLLHKFGGAALAKIIEKLGPEGVARITNYFDKITGGALSRLVNLPCVADVSNSQTGEVSETSGCGVALEKLLDLKPETIAELERLATKDARYAEIKDLAKRLTELPYAKDNPTIKESLIKLLSEAPEVPGQPQALKAAIDAALKQDNPGRFEEIIRAIERVKSGETFKKYGDSVTFINAAGKQEKLTADYVTEAGGKIIWTEVKSNAKDASLLDQLRRAEELYKAIQNGTVTTKVDQFRVDAVGTLPQPVIDFINNSPAKSFFAFTDGLTSSLKP